ncbi:TPA: tRNA pseudouridine(55) synthase TruB [candidate division CPR2 bacterium]|uniref:tRNA pseudouridine synthase B n=1 Tax=candidate division CPR2 bacterium GW2011_GWC1_41_48 TaxID=1618344 RepID=A0A0G0WBB0_UNCC2|nr:MAG: tRNA pseudouridine synthase B [candidate division CPR2 bacterium GW2011_GWC2_39_35]KKR28303.1 MAG: tRNA pseudouridine synthase B [candidate division CPR2 bacterium GW2011_GWD2_39_7]KKR28951.1 MAG: tRNA pseudouridine synthase B [candidate division CPR2 bacterium GW2011_GWD1_39_7]KKS09362.1 MAG: tRNA pseudouridine synthase B [candidate division CPR2 bacterium GW2011_GWC1_41_48]OGB61781.1 MAG: tRNA pseudouridine(55) synthase TruB [candidate division CPR2 bacterium GWD1_39_7]OGB72444.1 MAG
MNPLNKHNKGILFIDKPSGRSSFSIVAEVRRKLDIKKVGHAGTLDPFATGLLIILVGKENTKKAAAFLGKNKTYEATIDLSSTSTTGDPEGEIVKVSCQPPSQEEIVNVLKQFEGEQLQKPHMFSAVKIKGERAYKLAREGKQPEIEPKKIIIYKLDFISYNFPFLRIKTKVSSGTYIRVLAEDIGKALYCGGYLTELRRTSIGEFKIEEAISPDDIK